MLSTTEVEVSPADPSDEAAVSVAVTAVTVEDLVLAGDFQTTADLTVSIQVSDTFHDQATIAVAADSTVAVVLSDEVAAAITVVAIKANELIKYSQNSRLDDLSSRLFWFELK